MHANNDTPPGAAIQLRLKGETFASIENWRRSQSKIPSRADALRELVKLGLQLAEQSASA